MQSSLTCQFEHSGKVRSGLIGNFYSRSYAEDVTSVTSGASQGPHSFNLVFVCLCVCVFVSRLELPYLSRICPIPVIWCLFVCVYVLCHA